MIDVPHTEHTHIRMTMKINVVGSVKMLVPIYQSTCHHMPQAHTVRVLSVAR